MIYQLRQINEHNFIGIYYFSSKHTALSCKNRYCVALTQDNVSHRTLTTC